MPHESGPTAVPPPPPADQTPPAIPPSPGGAAARPPRQGMWVLIGAATLVVLSGLGVLGWFLLREPPIPSHEEAADTFGTALTSGSFRDVEVFTETSADPAEQYDLVFAGLHEHGTEPDVVVESVTPVAEDEDGTAAFTATYAWSWPLADGATWEYTTKVEFAYPGPDGFEPGVWRATWNPEVFAPDLEAGERLAVERAAAERGRITGAGGETIVQERDVFTVGVDKTRVGSGQWAATARSLADQLGFDAAARKDLVARTKAAGAEAFVQAIVIRKNDDDFDVDELAATPGVLLVPSSRALAPTAEFARPILGTTGEATAELVEESDGRIQGGDIVGISGVQAAYDEQLAGTPGIRVIASESEGGPGREVWTQEGEPGKPVELTLDVGTQERAEQVLADADEKSPSAIVAVNGKNGHVLAAASGPGSLGYDTAMLGQYPPGSTFKVAGALGMIRNGMTPDTTVNCPERIVVGKEFDNVDGYPTSALGQVPFRTAFANSCNTAMVGQHQKVSQQDLHDAAASLGLGVEAPGLGVSGYLGEVPVEDTSPADHAASFLGQARVLASPLAMATVAASVAGGQTVSPVLVADDGAASSDGDQGEDAAGGSDSGSGDAEGDGADRAAPENSLTPQEADTLRELMRGVVEDGSAQEALAGVPGVDGAKTGSAEGNDGKTNTWMLAVKGDIGVAVFVEDGDLGSTTAGPIMRQFLTGL